MRFRLTKHRLDVELALWELLGQAFEGLRRGAGVALAQRRVTIPVTRAFDVFRLREALEQVLERSPRLDVFLAMEPSHAHQEQRIVHVLALGVVAQEQLALVDRLLIRRIAGAADLAFLFAATKFGLRIVEGVEVGTTAEQQHGRGHDSGRDPRDSARRDDPALRLHEVRSSCCRCVSPRGRRPRSRSQPGARSGRDESSP